MNRPPPSVQLARDGTFAVAYYDGDEHLVSALETRLDTDRVGRERLRRRITYRSADPDGVRRLDLPAAAHTLNARPHVVVAPDVGGMPMTELDAVVGPLRRALACAWEHRAGAIGPLRQDELVRLSAAALTAAGREQWRIVRRIEDRIAVDVWLERLSDATAEAVVAALLEELPVVPADTIVPRRLQDACSRTLHEALNASRASVLAVLDPQWSARADALMRTRPTIAATVMNLHVVWLWARPHLGRSA